MLWALGSLARRKRTLSGKQFNLRVIHSASDRIKGSEAELFLLSQEPALFNEPEELSTRKSRFNTFGGTLD
jgi:hypothetical protein